MTKPDSVLIVPVARLDKLTRRAGLALFLACVAVAGAAAAILLFWAYLDSRAQFRDQQAAAVQQQVAQANYDGLVRACGVLSAVRDPLADRVFVQFGCDKLPRPGGDPDGPGPLHPAPVGP